MECNVMKQSWKMFLNWQNVLNMYRLWCEETKKAARRDAPASDMFTDEI